MRRAVEERSAANRRVALSQPSAFGQGGGSLGRPGAEEVQRLGAIVFAGGAVGVGEEIPGAHCGERLALVIQHRERGDAPPWRNDEALIDGRVADGRYAAVHVDPSHMQVHWNEIVAISAEDDYSLVRLVGGQEFLEMRPLAVWENTLPAAKFGRVHRSWIVGWRHVLRLRRTLGSRTARAAGHGSRGP